MKAEGLEPDTAHVSDSWIDNVKTKVSYEIPFNRHFYVFTPPRPLDVITNPRITPFLSTALERGCPIVDGVEMLVQLAMQIFQCWTGFSPEEEVFQRAVAEALGE